MDLEWENAVDTPPVRETLPTPQQMYKHGLEHLNISIDYWQRALTMIELSLMNQTDDRTNANTLIELKQKVQFLLNKIDVSASANELALILQQEQAAASVVPSSPVPSRHLDNYLNTINREESNRVQQELQTALSVQSDLTTFNDRRSLRSIRSTDSFQSCPDVNFVKFYSIEFEIFLFRKLNGLILVISFLIRHHLIILFHRSMSMDFV